MTRPAIELADIVRTRGRQFLERFKAILSYQSLNMCRVVGFYSVTVLCKCTINVAVPVSFCTDSFPSTGYRRF